MKAGGELRYFCGFVFFGNHMESDQVESNPVMFGPC